MKNFAIVPIKSKSKRVDNKNFRELNGKQLWKWTYDTIIELNIFDQIFLSSDAIENISIQKRDNVTLSKRSKELSKDNVHAIEVVFDVIKKYIPMIKEEDNIMMFLPTSPFRSKETIIKAISLIEKGYSSVVGIQKASKGSNSYRTFKKDSNLMHLPETSLLNIQSSEIKEYIVTGSIFASKYSSLKKYKTFHQSDGYGLIVSEADSIDINTELDFLTAETYASRII